MQHDRGLRRASFRFYAELDEFLPPSRRGVTFSHALEGRPTVKEAIEALGVPAAAVELVLVDGESVDFAHRLDGGVRVSVYPMFEALDVTPILQVRRNPLRQLRFVLDRHLEALAPRLRRLGLDVTCRRDASGGELARVASEEHRVLLTRDRGLLERRAVTHGLWLRSDEPERQLEELVQRLDLRRMVAQASRREP